MNEKKATLKFQRRGRTFGEYRTAYDAADDADALKRAFGKSAPEVARALRKGAFFLAVNGAKMTCGNGYRYILQ